MGSSNRRDGLLPCRREARLWLVVVLLALLAVGQVLAELETHDPAGISPAEIEAKVQPVLEDLFAQVPGDLAFTRRIILRRIG